MDLKIKNDKDTKQNVKVKSGILKKIFNKKVIAVICAIAVAGGGFTVYKVKTGAKKNTQSSRVRYTSLSKTNLYKMVSSSGAIKSGTSTSIYSNLNDYNVQQINVEVGDEVKKGDVLAIIDTSTLEDDIEKQELSVSANEKKAQIALEQAKDTYENSVYLYENNLNTTLVNAQAAVDQNKLSLDNKKSIYEYKQMMLDNGEESSQNVNLAKIDYENAQSDYDKSQIALSAAKVSVEQEIEKNKKSYESAQAAVDDTSSRLALEKQKEKLKDKEVVATVDGIVTAVNASVGSKCEDSLFVIQDLNDLIVKVSVDETEIANVAVGQKVQVTTDASTEILDGEVVTVDPISSAAASETSTSSSSSSSSKSSGTSSTSSNSTSSDVTFTVKVQITSEDIDKAVKVGMNAVVNIIIGESDDVFAVPYESIIDNHGQKSIYEAEEQNGQYVVKEISVTTGLESDMNTEIEGEDLKEGMIVLNDPSNYHVGSVVDINNGR
ncbi:efflux RND transporter periplasmic adaptor subunit [Clostridium butyricum]|uniref:efflux RND transporter periplasmic adaptor subunit n=1 Tax=Clostridium butyricum TaxID=1492 RepID=UPI0013D6A3EB|nr:efflux RND transporter periplasmic adaptor subunit [Clostridium butyricum]MCQ2018137.1 efflux RND transporter periplasmic adaptor subunit [Clostridium butyricum]MCQ2021875.1 efflux RND transporter periplasmic adaptor subunit [Clostridium butyricum]NFB72540.1 HlyD family efflux transporter periplasmic adaptor subunit [Clostridium butyricum]NFB91322.1 HlyD family efflux transporter periplasmic adaptor subunit [Clostridium butyricum]UTY52612.1 HlyD family efflux transporter periplasmic adaptor